jgi:hypothetical protein
MAVIGCGLLSPILDRPISIQEPRKFTELQFDAMVASLFDQGLIALDAIENDYLQ